MPRTQAYFYRDVEGGVPVLDWLRTLRERNQKAFAKCVVRIRRLAELGHELRRPEADLLRDGIHELRARLGTVNYRLLYFFHGQQVAVLGHALTKEDQMPDRHIELAVRRKLAFQRSPAKHTHTAEMPDA